MSYLKSTPSNLSNCKSYQKKQKCVNVGSKMLYLVLFDQKCLIRVFLGSNLKTILSYLKSAPSNLSNCKISQRNKMPKFGTKKSIFGYFWPRMPYLGIFGLEFLKDYCQTSTQHPWICQIAKHREVMKRNKFGTKSALLRYFPAKIFKNFCYIWNPCFRISVIAKSCEETKNA